MRSDITLLIDDAKEGGWADIIARNGEAAKILLERLQGLDVLLHIDHDLGKGISGLDVVKWALANGYLPSRVQIVSFNPVGRENIKNTLLDNHYTEGANSWFIRKEKNERTS